MSQMPDPSIPRWAPLFLPPTMLPSDHTVTHDYDPAAFDPDEIRETLAELDRLSALHGHRKAAIMLLSGLTSQEIDEVGGLDDVSDHAD